MKRGERGFHGITFDDERNIGFGRTLGDGNDVDVTAPECAESAASNSRNAAHIFADHCNDGNFGVECDVLDIVMREILRELFTQCFDGAPGIAGGYDEADVVLR